MGLFLLVLSSVLGNTRSEVGWKADRADSICGLDDVKTLSKPCKVSYGQLLEATSQYKKIKDNKILPDSPEGIQLKTEAANVVRDACEKIRAKESYCSVWKEISHSDGRGVMDITELVKKEIK